MGRYAAELIRELAGLSGEGTEIKVLLPEVAEARPLAGEVAENLAVVMAPFAGSDQADYAERALQASDPAQSLGRVDVLHSLTRFVPETCIPRIVTTVHDIAPLSVPAFKPEVAGATRLALRRLCERQATIIAVSAYTKRELCERAKLPAERVMVVHEGVPSRYLTAGADRRDNGRVGGYVLYVGGAGPNKNLPRLVEAVSLVRRFARRRAARARRRPRVGL